MNKHLIRKSKLLSLVLRHNPKQLSITLNKNGWAKINDLINTGEFTSNEISIIVANNNKRRFSFNDDKTKIRAVQGHSVDVDLELKPLDKLLVPEYLYHGTSRKNVKSIKTYGLHTGTRQYVHLSKDVETAEKVGKRRDYIPLILKIKAQKMIQDGLEIFLSENGIYLANEVSGKYIEVLHDN